MEKSTVIGCTAAQGGGVYMTGANASMSLSDGARITGNSLSGSDVTQGGGVYVDGGTISVGGSAYVYGNTTVGRTETETDSDGNTVTSTIPGGQSNMRLAGNSSDEWIRLTSSLTNEARIGICNAGSAGYQFGEGSTAGLTGQGRFMDDVDGMTGTLVENDPTGIYWKITPICQLTTPDAVEGSPAYGRKLLYTLTRNGKYVPCQYMSLKTAIADANTKAISPAATNDLYYTDDGITYTKYTDKRNLNIEFLVPEYSMAHRDRAFNGHLQANIKITTNTQTMADNNGNPTTVKRGSCNENFIRLESSDYTMTLEDIIFDGENTPVNNLGAMIHLYLGKFVLGKGAIIQNGYSTAHCGGIDVDGGTLTIDGGTIQHCRCDTGKEHPPVHEGYAGGIHIHTHSGAYVKFISGTIRDCHAQTFGGAIYAERDMDFQGGVIENCSAKNGGAIYFKTGTITLDSGSKITNCSATDRGGAIVQEDGTLTIRGTAVVENCYAGQTGAIYIGNGTASTGFAHETAAQDNTWNTNWNRNRKSVTVNIAGSPQVINNWMGTATEKTTSNIDLRRITETGDNFNEVINATGLMKDAQVGLYITNASHDTAGEKFGTTVEAAANYGLHGFINDIHTPLVGWPCKANTAGYAYWVAPIMLEARIITSGSESQFVEGSKGIFALDAEDTEISAEKNANPSLPLAYAEMNDAVKAIYSRQQCTYMYAKIGNTTIKALRYIPADGNWQYTVDGAEWEKIDEAKETVTLYFKPVCKIVDTNPAGGSRVGTTAHYEHIFATLNAAVNYARNDFTNGNPMSATNPVTIEMLMDYVIPADDAVSLSTTDKIVLTTAGTEDEAKAAGETYYFHTSFTSADGRAATDSGAVAIIKRSSDWNDTPMFTVENGAALTFDGVALDGNAVDVAHDGGLVLAQGGNLTVQESDSAKPTTLRNSKAKNGGAVYVASGAEMAMTGGTVCGNTASVSGAGIYLVEGSKLNISGSPSFGGTSATDGNHIGTGTNAKREDIYIAGYLGLNGTDPKLADSLIVTGKLYGSLTTEQAKGQIWVGAQQQDNEDNNHWDTLKQFAKFDNSLMTTDSSGNTSIDSSMLDSTDVEKIYVAFRNATLTDDTYGMTGDGQTGGVQCIYWEGVQGSRKVVLRKVSTAYDSLQGAEFTIQKGSKLIEGTDSQGAVTKTFTSGETGVFYVGTMNYGVYVLNEITHPANYSGDSYYYLIVDDDGAEMSLPSAGYDTETKAKAAGDALFKSRQAARKAAAATNP